MTAPSTLKRTSTPDLSAGSPLQVAGSYPQSTGGLGEWWQRAACRDRNAELFFHSDHERGPSRAMRTAKAKAVCATCPVMALCRDYALAQPEPYGIWGGLDEQERAQILRQQVS
ncbi:WhiB family transcriptional regulator [Ornithinimicrobium sufpigmenti]|uniref:WhiB family transcriptional regulator n=1 Tax=Ornithinimicrobium sufpigmenti TaxID=2508882 RepID=UPI0010360224|nr:MULTISPECIES: WhiB family transcriptional regulator [unclassified Ornithinimicrobium]